jgi:hypothetical protein
LNPDENKVTALTITAGTARHVVASFVNGTRFIGLLSRR